MLPNVPVTTVRGGASKVEPLHWCKNLRSSERHTWKSMSLSILKSRMMLACYRSFRVPVSTYETHLIRYRRGSCLPLDKQKASIMRTMSNVRTHTSVWHLNNATRSTLWVQRIRKSAVFENDKPALCIACVVLAQRCESVLCTLHFLLFLLQDPS